MIFTNKKTEGGNKLSGFLRRYKMKRFEKKLQKWRPDLINTWKDNIEQKFQKEYNEEIEKLNDQVFDLNKEVRELTHKLGHMTGRYEALKEREDTLLGRVEKLNEKQGKLITENKAVIGELKEIKEDKSEQNDIPQNEEIVRKQDIIKENKRGARRNIIQNKMQKVIN